MVEEPMVEEPMVEEAMVEEPTMPEPTKPIVTITNDGSCGLDGVKSVTCGATAKEGRPSGCCESAPFCHPVEPMCTSTHPKLAVFGSEGDKVSICLMYICVCMQMGALLSYDCVNHSLIQYSFLFISSGRELRCRCQGGPPSALCRGTLLRPGERRLHLRRHWRHFLLRRGR